MRLEVGKNYKTKSGEKITCIYIGKADLRVEYALCVNRLHHKDKIVYYTTTGIYVSGIANGILTDWDIASEWTEPVSIKIQVYWDKEVSIYFPVNVGEYFDWSVLNGKKGTLTFVEDK